jgi:hypothetical protein
MASELVSYLEIICRCIPNYLLPLKAVELPMPLNLMQPSDSFEKHEPPGHQVCIQFLFLLHRQHTSPFAPYVLFCLLCFLSFLAVHSGKLSSSVIFEILYLARYSTLCQQAIISLLSALVNISLHPPNASIIF